jgi:hypothetical protein
MKIRIKQMGGVYEVDVKLFIEVKITKDGSLAKYDDGDYIIQGWVSSEAATAIKKYLETENHEEEVL